MYDIAHFKSANDASVWQFMQANPLALFCGVNTQGLPIATHIPVLLEKRNDGLYLLGHLMRKQLHTVAFIEKPQVMAIFSNQGAYVSARWYQTVNRASTWNYQAVHVHGKLRFVDTPSLQQILIKLTRFFEESENSVADVETMPVEYVNEHMKAIIGFEMKIEHIEHVFKLSQNKTEEERSKIIQELQKKGTNGKIMAEAMQHFYKNQLCKKDAFGY
jgi:transcriptional regulator